MGTESNIVVIQPQGIYWEAVGTALPTITGTLGNTIDFSAWNDTGFIDPEGKIKLGFGANIRNVRPMGYEGNLKGFALQKTCSIEFVGIEETLQAIQMALGGADGDPSTLGDGGDAELNYIALAVVTNNVVYHFKKVAPNHELAKEIADTEEGKTPYLLATYVEEGAAAGERQWKIHKRT